MLCRGWRPARTPWPRAGSKTRAGCRRPRSAGMHAAPGRSDAEDPRARRLLHQRRREASPSPVRSAAQRLLRDIPADRLTDRPALVWASSTASSRPARPRLPGPGERAVRDINPVPGQSRCHPADERRSAHRRHAPLGLRRMAPLPDGRLRGGASTVAQVVGAAAQADPDRFTSVLESLPADIHDVYTQHILSGLSRSTATPSQLLHAMKAARARTGACQYRGSPGSSARSRHTWIPRCSLMPGCR